MYHRTAEVRKFLKEHPILKIKLFGKKDPNTNPVEGLVNKRLSSAVSVNRACENLDELELKTKKFLSKHNPIYET